MKNKVENLIRERNLLVGRLNGYRRVQEVEIKKNSVMKRLTKGGIMVNE